MDAARFDRLTRALGRPRSRRGLLAGLLTGVALRVPLLGTTALAQEGPPNCGCGDSICLKDPDGTFRGCCGGAPCPRPDGYYGGCCSADTTCCGGVCCPESQFCVAPGTCSPCPIGSPRCGDHCCPNGQECGPNDQCADACPEGAVACGGACCDAGQACQEGTCISACPTGRTARDRTARARRQARAHRDLPPPPPPPPTCYCAGTTCGGECCGDGVGCDISGGCTVPCAGGQLSCGGTCILPCGPGFVLNAYTCACECKGPPCGATCCSVGQVCAFDDKDAPTCCAPNDLCGGFCKSDPAIVCCKAGGQGVGRSCFAGQSCCGRTCCNKHAETCRGGKCVKKKKPKTKHH